MNTIVEGGINEMYIDQEKFKSFLFAMVMFALGFALCYCMLGSRDNPTGTSNVAGGINSATVNNQQAEKERKQAETGINSAEARLENVQRSLDETRDLFDQHEASLRRCQQILDSIKQRGKS